MRADAIHGIGFESLKRACNGLWSVHKVNVLDNCEISLLRIQWNLCIMDTLGPTKGVQIIKVS